MLAEHLLDIFIVLVGTGGNCHGDISGGDFICDEY